MLSTITATTANWYQLYPPLSRTDYMLYMQKYNKEENKTACVCQLRTKLHCTVTHD